MSRHLRRPLMVRCLEDRTAPATFTVLNLNDSGADSLRDCVSKANAAGGADTVDFKSGLTGTITLASEISITESVAITGPGADKLTVSGNNAVRIFSQQITAAVEVDSVIEGLTLTAGKGQGGAVFVRDFSAPARQDGMTIRRCVVSGHSSGGAIAVFAASLVVEDCALTGNTSGGNGGAIMVGNGVIVRVERSTLSGNSAVTGGGVYLGGFENGFNFQFRNSTFSGNSASGRGGGIGAYGYFGPSFTVTGCTITNNISGKGGGGISNDCFPDNENVGIVTLNSSVVSGNTDLAGTNEDLLFRYNALKANFSLIGHKAAGFVLDATTTSLVGNAPMLGLLADNGGPTQTHLPLAGSPLLNNGSNPAPLATTDQRGAGFFRTAGTGTDIGAVEVQNPTFVVSNLNDGGSGSLRQAVLNANAAPGHDAIEFAPGLSGIITLSGGEIAINEGLAINGPGSSILTVSGNKASRIFNIAGMPASPSGFLIINGLTLTNGLVSGPSGTGGAINGVDESLLVNNCVLIGNTANVGGAICLNGGIVTVTNSSFSGNSATNSGGAMFNGGGPNASISMTACTVSGNSAPTAGGIYAQSFLFLSECTVSANTANGGLGGGISTGTLAGATRTIRNSTISGNSAAVGGGIALVNFSGELVIHNSTVTANIASGKGGGVALLNGTATISLESSVVSGNTNASAPDIYNPGTVNVKTSAVGSSSGFTKTDQGGNLAFGTDLKLGPLANNGGPTLTHALLPGSPCINAGANAGGLTTDQRGTGFVRVFGSAADIGAFEVQLVAAKVQAVVVNAGAAQRSTVTQLEVTFDSPVTFAGAPAAAFTLVRPSDNSAVTLAAAVNGTSTVVTLTFTGGAVDGKSLADGRYTLTALSAQFTGGGLDGNGDGSPGDNFVLIGDPAISPKLYRLFGDADGDGDVDTTDFGAFRTVFGGNSTMFDFDNDGDVDTSDFGAFRQRFGASV